MRRTKKRLEASIEVHRCGETADPSGYSAADQPGKTRRSPLRFLIHPHVTGILDGLTVPILGVLRSSEKLMAVLMRPWLMPLLALSLVPAALSAGDWTRFRGPNGTGLASAPGLPVEWSQPDYAWSVAVAGVGHSSPVVSGERLFVTSASEDGTERRLLCIDAKSGKTVWTRVLGLSADKLHLKNSHASGTPAVGGEFVYVTFADDSRYVAAAFGLDGKPAWTRDLGTFESQHGHGSSPIVWRDLVIVPDDQDGPSALVALSAGTGEVEWKTPRTPGDTSYSTPFILEAKAGPPQLITSCNAMGVTSTDPETGRLNWQSGPMPQRTVGSPMFAGGLIFQTCGQAGRGTFMVGVDPFAEDGAERVVVEQSKMLPYVPTPVEYEGRLYLWNDNGVVVCLDGKTFEPVWTERVGGNFSGSPVCVNGRLYAASEEGEVVVVRAAPKFELLGRSPLGDRTYATPAVAGGKMFFRTFGRVLCLAPKSPAT